MKATKTLFKLTILLLVGINSPLIAQDMPQSVVGSAGSYYQNLLFGNLHWTVGEVAVSRFQNGEELGEGFHQAYYDLLVKTIDIIPSDWEVNVYPNPTADQLHVKIPNGQKAELYLYSTMGQLLRSNKNVLSTIELDVANLPAGAYWLKLIDENGRQKNFQVQKIHQ